MLTAPIDGKNKFAAGLKTVVHLLICANRSWSLVFIHTNMTFKRVGDVLLYINTTFIIIIIILLL